MAELVVTVAFCCPRRAGRVARRPVSSAASASVMTEASLVSKSESLTGTGTARKPYVASQLG